MRNVLLYLHILAVVLAFGPTFVFPLLGVMAGKDPRFAPWAAKIGVVVGAKLIAPFAILTLLTGVGLVMLDTAVAKQAWLGIAVGLFLVALAYSFFVQMPNGRKLAAFADKALAGGPPPEGAPPGPPPEVMALVKKQKMGGMLLGMLFLIVLGLMVFKP